MDAAMSTGFTAGSGMDPLTMKVMLDTIASGVLLLIFAWLIVQIIRSYKDGTVEVADATWNSIKAAVIFSLLFYFVFR